MRVGIIGRSEILYDVILLLEEAGHSIELIITSKEAPEYTKTSKDFKEKSKELNASFIYTPKILEAFEEIKGLNLDIAVSVNYNGIIPQKIIDCFNIGILNAHGGDLPKYRGNACQAWAILNGEKRVGLCVHKMIGGELDNGDIIAKDYLEIDINTKVGFIWNWMKERIPLLFLEALSKLGTDKNFILEKQDSNLVTAHRCYPRKPEDGRIDWTQSAENILRLINASGKPYSGAYCNFEKKKLIIWDAELVNDGEIYSAVPGQITGLEKESIIISTGQGKLKINKIDYNGIVNPREVINSIRSRLN